MKQSVADPLQIYVGLIERYHGALNLMSAKAVGEVGSMVEEAVRYAEFIASLSPAPRSILDLGSGVGLPGIPIALGLPQCDVMLVERRRRRASFLRIAVSQLGLVNAKVTPGDVRSIHAPCADVVVAQAVGTLAHVYELTRHLHGEQIWLLSRKGESWREELDELEVAAGAAVAERHEEALSPHGRLVAVLLPGGSACPPSG